MAGMGPEKGTISYLSPEHSQRKIRALNLETFARRRARQSVDEMKDRWHFVRVELLEAIASKRSRIGVGGNDCCLDEFFANCPQPGISDRVFDRGMLQQHSLNFERVDLHPTEIDNVPDPANQNEAAGIVDEPDIAGGEESLRSIDPRARPLALHDRRRSDMEFANAVSEIGIGILIP